MGIYGNFAPIDYDVCINKTHNKPNTLVRRANLTFSPKTHYETGGHYWFVGKNLDEQIHGDGKHGGLSHYHRMSMNDVYDSSGTKIADGNWLHFYANFNPKGGFAKNNPRIYILNTFEKSINYAQSQKYTCAKVAYQNNYI